MAALQSQIIILLVLVAIAWLMELIDLFLLGRSLDRFGIRPRSLSGLWGIFFAPFLHGGLAHLIANTLPFFFLGWLTMVRRTSDFVVVTIVVLVVGGLGVWVFAAANTIHIGASGLIFGYLGYLLLRGYFERSFTAILIAVVVGVLYGGALWGVLPSRPGISWQGHLFGFIGGAIAARMLTAPRSSP
jgi:membrane associated rhomboid family serine protease